MSQATKRRPRVAFNKVVRTLSELYNLPYNEVMKIYRNQGDNIQYTKMILNLKTNNTNA